MEPGLSSSISADVHCTPCQCRTAAGAPKTTCVTCSPVGASTEEISEVFLRALPKKMQVLNALCDMFFHIIVRLGWRRGTVLPGTTKRPMHEPRRCVGLPVSREETIQEIPR
jgi:hypothetical protein